MSARVAEPESRSRRWYGLGAVLAVAVLAAIVVGVVATVALVRSLSNAWVTPAQERASASAAPVVTATPAAQAPVVAAATASAPSTSRRVLLPTDPDPKNPDERATPKANYGDAFESWDGKPSEVRTLVTVKGIRLGVARVATVRDERKVTALLGDLGEELAKREAGRHDSWESRAHAYHDMMDSYGRKLGPYMSGDFAFHTGQWVLFQPAIDPSAPPASSAAN